MAEGKSTFQLYTEWIDTFEELTNEEAGQLIKHIFRYVNDKNPELKDRLLKVVFTPIKQTLKRDLKKWEKICERNMKNGGKGGRPKNPDKPSGFLDNPDKPKKPDKDKDKDKDISSSVPSLNDVKEYFKENGYKEEAAINAFWYYEQPRLDDGLSVWVDSKGNEVQRWKTKMRMVWFKKENEIEKDPPMPKTITNPFFKDMKPQFRGNK